MNEKHRQILLISIASSAATALVVSLVAANLLLIGRPLPAGNGLAGSETFSSRTVEGDSIVVKTIKEINPAVVSITVTKNVPVVEQYFRNIDPFDFFGDGLFDIPLPQYRQNGTEKREVGGGSGFFVSADGYIITNRHVVDDKTAEYTVFTNDGKKHSAKVIALDPVLDIALIKIDGNDHPYLEFGDSSKLEVGQTAIAIGNALAEFRNTVSVGVVSGLGRSIIAGDRYGGETETLDELIQTDAAINPGNSGGPLLDITGKVIGVNVAVASGAQNIGFALPSNMVKNVVLSVKKYGKIVRPYLGVRFTMITEELKNRNRLEVDYGALIIRGQDPSDLAVIPGSPADKAGFVENDIILEIDGVKLTNDRSLAAIIQSKNIGDTITLKVLSKGRQKTVNVTLEEIRE